MNRAKITCFPDDVTRCPWRVRVNGMDMGRFATCKEALDYCRTAERLYAEEAEAWAAYWRDK